MSKITMWRRTPTPEELPSAILDAIRAMLKSANVPAERIEQGLAVLDGRAVAVSHETKEWYDHADEELPEIITRAELAQKMKVKPHTVDYHRRAGHLQPVYWPGSGRIRGFTSDSCRALLRGETNAK